MPFPREAGPPLQPRLKVLGFGKTLHNKMGSMVVVVVVLRRISMLCLSAVRVHASNLVLRSWRRNAGAAGLMASR